MRLSLIAVLLFWAAGVSAQSKLITLEDLWVNGTFAAKSVPGFNALPDGEHYTDVSEEGGKHTIHIKNLRDGKETGTLYSGTLPVDDYIISDQRDKLLILTESQNIYRRSVLHRVYIYDVKTGQETSLDTGKVLHATFSPDGTKVAYVKDNNLYYKDLESGNVTAVTHDGEKNKIINGNCDWVYEEEFEFTRAYEWAPDSRHLAYYRFDESAVKEYTMTVYDKLYPTPYKYKYPKAGEGNSTIDILCYDVQNGNSALMHVLKAGDDADIYVPRLKWSNDPDELCIYKMNRRQNRLTLLMANAKNGIANAVYEEKNKAYIEINDNMHFLKNGHSILFNSERDGWNHLYTWDWKAERLTLLTKGDYDIDALVGVDEATKTVYYTAAETSPLERKLYAVSFSGKGKHC